MAWKIHFLLKGAPVSCHVSWREGLSQLTWKCTFAPFFKREVVLLKGSVHFHVSWWEGNLHGLPWLFGEGWMADCGAGRVNGNMD